MIGHSAQWQAVQPSTVSLSHKPGVSQHPSLTPFSYSPRPVILPSKMSSVSPAFCCYSHLTCLSSGLCLLYHLDYCPSFLFVLSASSMLLPRVPFKCLLLESLPSFLHSLPTQPMSQSLLSSSPPHFIGLLSGCIYPLPGARRAFIFAATFAQNALQHLTTWSASSYSCLKTDPFLSQPDSKCFICSVITLTTLFMSFTAT